MEIYPPPSWEEMDSRKPLRWLTWLIEIKTSSPVLFSLLPRLHSAQMSSSTKFLLPHMEKFHTLRGGGGGQTQLSVYTQKNAVSDPASGVEPYSFGWAQKAGQTPQSRQVNSVYTEGQKAGLTPHLGFDPAIGALCKRGIQLINLNFEVNL